MKHLTATFKELNDCFGRPKAATKNSFWKQKNHGIPDKYDGQTVYTWTVPCAVGEAIIFDHWVLTRPDSEQINTLTAVKENTSWKVKGSQAQLADINRQLENYRSR